MMCLAASFLVNQRRFGGSTAHQAPEPVPSLARLFSRPRSSVLAKMANLDGSRSHGGKWDVLAVPCSAMSPHISPTSTAC